MPPRHGKSEETSHWFPVWYLNALPSHRLMLASYEADFAASWGRKVRNTVVENEEHLRVRITNDSSAANRWDTTEGGGMTTAGAGGPMTGKGAHVLMLDDPIKNAEEASSKRVRDSLWDWWTSTAYTRLEPDGIAIITMTRWNEDDLVGRLLAEMANGGEQWDVLSLSAICDTPDDAIGRALGEPLWPGRYDIEDLERIKRAVGSRVWNALYQQRPAPDAGSIIYRAWLTRFWKVLPARFDEMIQSWDFSFKETKTGSYVVGQVWGRVGAEKYLVDQVRARMDFVASLAAVRALTAKWPQAVAKLIEAKANGPAIVASLRKEIPGLIEIEPGGVGTGKGAKDARLTAIAPEFEAGNVILPDPTIAPWVHDYIEELVTIPHAANDDQGDCTSQALARWSLRATATFSQRPGQHTGRRM